MDQRTLTDAPSLLDLGEVIKLTKGSMTGLVDMGGGERMPLDGVSED